ncbi:mitochondrial import inner membrane translocase subunit TIM54 [Rhizoctonia solani]|uniref:Mitochondrial import inner membrane translocase subunit TIM54 n=1 Tax=Rhizoctonia solani TaxID=456999 RepID=A0A8H8SSX3_9AGAM|nr:mitochondrial import inner membrane translocase subunit TIM54 [Rhizoctonia solani]QRW16469.1 mitochondrial import inner membrane translocase subunit TIM54 [Rhizoctonia solani]
MEYQEYPSRSWHASSIHPQSDDYYDDIDAYSSPTPLPRQPKGAGHSVMEFDLSESLGARVEDSDGTARYDCKLDIMIDQYLNKVPPPLTRHRVLYQKAWLTALDNTADWCRDIFKFGVFNAMQSQCFNTAVNTESNMVISAPTGAGKTVLFELSIIRLLQSQSNVTQTTYKCVYMAPTKAICSERSRDWSAKFSHLGIKCCELTGDTMKSGRSAWKEAKNCAIIITTPEKWDSLTRNWNDSNDFLQLIKVFMVDEVSAPPVIVCPDLSTGIGSYCRGNHKRKLPGVSATVPNIEDLKDWLSSCSSGEPTRMFKFGDEYRPCRLQRHVYGYSRPTGHNDFMKTLDYKLFPIIQEHSTGKPVLVFCPTRKSVMATASYLMGVCQKMVESKENLPWELPRGQHILRATTSRQVIATTQCRTFDDDLLRPEFAALGLGVHHAGLSLDERHTVERLFTERKLSVIVATSTLAVGVNFPAHIVIVKGVSQWTGTGWAEYSSQDIMQMLGRAGRPQFDREGIAIIMCDKTLENKYRLLATGGSELESTLHCNLTEHINSEIGLGTIKSIGSAQQWLRKTLLFRRIQKNPTHYKLGMPETASWEECVDALVIRSIDTLRGTQLVEHDEDEGTLSLTQFGEIMSYYIRQSTMKLFIEFADSSNTACLRSVLVTLSDAEEFKDMHMRGGERQAILGGIPLMSPEYKSPNSQPHMEALNVIRHAPRMITALVDTALITKNGSLIINGMNCEFIPLPHGTPGYEWLNRNRMRCLNGKVWEDRPAVLKQFDGIGEKSCKVLAENGITTIKLLSVQNPDRIDMLLNRRPPFGSDIVLSARALPIYSIFIEELSSTANKIANTIDVKLLVSVLAQYASTEGSQSRSDFDTRVTSILTITSDNQLIDFRRINTRRLLESIDFSITAPLTKPSQEVFVIVSSDKFAGITERCNFKPTLPATTYPTLNTRPPKPTETEYIEEEVLDLTNSDTPEESTSSKKSGEKRVISQGKNLQPELQKPAFPTEIMHATTDVRIRLHVGIYGLTKPPPSPRGAKLKSTGDNAFNNPIDSQQKPKNALEKQKSQLDYLHGKITDGLGRLKRDSLVHPRDTHSSTKATVRYVDSLLSSPIKPSAYKPGEKSPNSDQDLPEPSLIRIKKHISPGSGSTNYDDSDMDQWAANLPSEVLELDVETPTSPTREDQNDGRLPIAVSPIIKNKKRRVIDKGNELSEHKSKRSKAEFPAGVNTPIRRRKGVEILPTPRSSSRPLEPPIQPKPLFLPGSSVGTPSPRIFKASEGKSKTPTSEDAFEDFMDYIFEGVKVVPGSTREDTSTMARIENIQVPKCKPVEVSLERKYFQESPSKVVQKLTSMVSSENETLLANPHDSMADFNNWLDENGLWPGDDDHDRSMKYFRKYVKPILVAAAVDFELVNGNRHGGLARSIADKIKSRRRETLPPDHPLRGDDQASIVPIPSATTPQKQQEREIQGGILIVGRHTLKEYFHGLRLGWTEGLRDIDREELLARQLASDGVFDEPEDLNNETFSSISGPKSPLFSHVISQPAKSSSKTSGPQRITQSNETPAIPQEIPPQPPLLLLSFQNLIGFRYIPHMIIDFFNERRRAKEGAEAAYTLIEGHTRDFIPPEHRADLDSLYSRSDAAEPEALSVSLPKLGPQGGDIDFDIDLERYIPKSYDKTPKEIADARKKYYDALPGKLVVARSLARGEREPTKEEREHPPPTEVELTTERFKKELKWKEELDGWKLLRAGSGVDWDHRFVNKLHVYQPPTETSA